MVSGSMTRLSWYRGSATFERLRYLIKPLAKLAPALAICAFMSAAARKRIERDFPGRDVHIIEMLASRYDGGGVHCHSNDQPAL